MNQQERELNRMETELKINTIRALQELLWKETHWPNQEVFNRIGLSEADQNIVKAKLIEKVKSL